MREEYEFRVLEEYASRLFSASEGKRGVLARTIRLFADDPRFEKIGAIDREVAQETGDQFFYGWHITRRYTQRELSTALLFHLSVLPTSYFEPAGEECGTAYDETAACTSCGAGAQQTSGLRLRIAKIPSGKDITKTIAGEIVVSQSFADACAEAGVTGVAFQRVEAVAPVRPNHRHWYQLLPEEPYVEITPPTRTGIGPFDPDNKNEYRCPKGDTIGLNLLSEISVKSIDGNWPDLVWTRQFIGRRSGLLRPERQIIVSKKVRRLLHTAALKGGRLEIAREGF